MTRQFAPAAGIGVAGIVVAIVLAFSREGAVASMVLRSPLVPEH